MTKAVATKKKPTNALAPRPSEPVHGKLPPQAIDKEELVLGKLINNKNDLAAIVDRLRPHHFYRAQHQAIYEAILRLFSLGKPVDLHTIVDALRKEAKLEFAGGPHALVMLSSQDTSASNILHDCTVIIEMAMKRELITLCSTVFHDAHEYTTDANSLLDLTERTLMQIVDQNVRHNTNAIGTTMQLALNQIKTAMNLSNNGITGVPCGLTELDRILSGWQNSDLILLAARPGMGKSGAVVTFLRNAAINFRKRIGLFSLEMATYQIVNRMISAEAHVASELLRTGRMTEEDWAAIMSRFDALAQAPIFIDDTPALTIQEFRTKARRLKVEQKVELIVVDYLQLMQGNQEGNREQEISSISQALKAVAKELNIPILALSQLSRQSETRAGDKRPQLSDLRESGSLEQDADVVIFLYRPEYYKITIDEEGLSTQGVGEFIVAKHRNGSTGTAKCKFISKYTCFTDLEN